MRYFYVILFSFLSFSIFGQETALISGKISDAVSDAYIDFATVYVEGTNNATESDENGFYELKIPANLPFTLKVTRIGYREFEKIIPPVSIGKTYNLNVVLFGKDSDVEVIVTSQKTDNASVIVEKVKELKRIPSTTGNLESVLPHIALGTTSGTGGELSSQYNVRGGNYDENLVYVNDFEIYRPQLIQAGQQEGLSFPNIDLIRDLSFSSGGFESKYGDKMSSVLDIKYKRPDALRASIGMSFLGGSAHVEGSRKLGESSYRKFRYLVGARYKTTSYLLGSLDVKGEYTPSFTDIQGYFTYDINENLQVGLLTNFNRSDYSFVPKSRSTAFGLVNYTLQLNSVFEGQEVDDFTTGLGGLSLTYLPDRDRNPLYMKFLTSAFQSNEKVGYDLLGYYSLGQIETSLGSENIGEVIDVLGTGVQHEFVRDYLTSNVFNAEHKGGIELQLDTDFDKEISHFLQWGLKYQKELINDEINEWERIDSAGYTLPYDENQVLLSNVLKTENTFSSNRITGFVQNTYTVKNDSSGMMKLTAGIRLSYWDLNNEMLYSPRLQFLYNPFKKKKKISYRVATGLYHQPAFYREMRRPDGTVNRDLKSQKSAHIVAGMSYDFDYKKKPFRFITELYYKKLWDLVSYNLDNVRINYSGENDATGYIMGADFRINGEFVPGAESWINISVLRARESLNDIQHLKREIGVEDAIAVKDVPRPTDRFFSLSMFFQDYLPKNDNFRMHLNLTFGTGFPFGIKGNNTVYRNTYRYKAYHRADIGFGFQLFDEERRAKKPNHWLRFTKNTWLSLEVFNLLQVTNAASYTWIKTIYGNQFGVPNYLTSRRVNLRLKMDF